MDAIVQAILDWLSKHFAQEQQVITSAPVAFVVCVGVASVAIFFTLRWHFKHELSARDGTIQIHEERHKLKDEKLADFLSRTERASPEQLADQIAALRADLESQKHRTLSAKQRHDLEAAIRATLRDKEYLGFSLYYNWLDPEAEQYARQFAAVFIPLSVSGVPGPTQDVPPDLEGLVIGVKDERTIPRNAQRLSDALTTANITHRFGTVTGPRNSLLKGSR